MNCKDEVVMKFCFSLLLMMPFLMGGFVSDGYAAEKAKISPHIEFLDKETMQKLAKPGTALEDPHHILPMLMGAWDFDLKYWSGKDDGAQTSTGTVTNETVMGGRFLSGKANIILNIGGQNIPYEGWTLFGYDGVRKQYTSVLLDSLYAGMTVGSGQYNEKTKTLEEKGSFADPVTGKERTYRSELQFVNADSFKRTVYVSGASGEFKVLEMDFRRKR